MNRASRRDFVSRCRVAADFRTRAHVFSRIIVRNTIRVTGSNTDVISRLIDPHSRNNVWNNATTLSWHNAHTRCAPEMISLNFSRARLLLIHELINNANWVAKKLRVLILTRGNFDTRDILIKFFAKTREINPSYISIVSYQYFVYLRMCNI